MRPSMTAEAIKWRGFFLRGDGRFRWGCGCVACNAECNAYLDAVVAEALFGWLRGAA